MVSSAIPLVLYNEVKHQVVDMTRSRLTYKDHAEPCYSPHHGCQIQAPSISDYAQNDGLVPPMRTNYCSFYGRSSFDQLEVVKRRQSARSGSHPMMNMIFSGPVPCCSKYRECFSNGSPLLRMLDTGQRPLRVQVVGSKSVGNSFMSGFWSTPIREDA